MAKNFDWMQGEGELILRPANIRKISLFRTHEWIAQYSSVTFSLFGPDFPTGGVNEKGLAIEALILPEAESEITGDFQLNEAEWMQYQLDRYSSVDEVIQNLKKTGIKRAYVPVHYFLCDRTAKCVVIDPLSNEFQVYENLEHKQITNSSLEASTDFLEKPSLYSQRQRSRTLGSLNRYLRLSKQSIAPSELSLNTVKEKLDSVKIAGWTKWQIIYDLANERLHYKFAANTSYQTLNVEKLLNQTCSEDILSADIMVNNFSSKLTVDNLLKQKVIKRLQKTAGINDSIIEAIKMKSFKNNCL